MSLRQRLLAPFAHTSSARPSRSLLTRVAAASAGGATIVVATIGTLVWSGVENDEYLQLDRQLEVVTTVAANLAHNNPFGASSEVTDGYIGTYRLGPVVVPVGALLPALDEGFATINFNGQRYRVMTQAVPQGFGATVAIATPTAETDATIHRNQRNTILVCLLAIAAAAALGWVFAALAVRPLRQLAAQTRLIKSGSEASPPQVKGVLEAEELADAIGGMLSRIRQEQERTEQALETARDFAAVSAHELRTPLTAMRTNLEVLATLDLPEPDRREVLDDVLRAQDRVEATLYALERLASGELTRPSDHTPIEVGDLLDVAAQDAARTYPGVAIALGVTDPVTINGLPTGLRLAVDNAITNAVKHGGATAIELSVRAHGEGVDICVDDNGTGIPEEERARVFEKFARGSNAAQSGSGLGLALVAQQAALHDGAAEIGDSHLGGARLTIRVSAERVCPG